MRKKMIKLQKDRVEAEELLERVGWMIEVDIEQGRSPALADVARDTASYLAEIDRQFAEADRAR